MRRIYAAFKLFGRASESHIVSSRNLRDEPAPQPRFAEMADIGFPPEIVESIKDSIDCNIYFFGTKVGQGTMYIILTCSIVVFVGIYILMNVLSKAKKHK